MKTLAKILSVLALIVAPLLAQPSNLYLPRNNPTFGGTLTGTVANITTVTGNLTGTVGGVTPAAGAFTTLSSTGNYTFGTAGSILSGTTADQKLTLTGTNQSFTITPSGTGNLILGSGKFSSPASTVLTLNSGSGAANSLLVQLAGTTKLTVGTDGTTTNANGSKFGVWSLGGALAADNNYAINLGELGASTPIIRNAYYASCGIIFDSGHIAIQDASGTAKILSGANSWVFSTSSTTALTLDSSGNGAVAGNWTIKGTSAITGVRTATATLDFGSILAAASADLTITVTGAAVGDACALGTPAAPDASITFTTFVSATNTVTVRAFNVGAIAVDQASATFRAVAVSF